MTVAKTIRGYELREQIGRGGFGVVYRAYQPIVDREVAIKVILPQFVNNPDFVRNFETEAQVIARLAHPFVVPLFDYWREPDGAYLVMRFLTGGSWRQLLSYNEPVSASRLAPMLLQVTAALDAAHRAQIIHRDIKPENILLDDEGNTYLADFGIAKKLDPSDESDKNHFRGTLAYTAPEIIQFSQVSPASDIYSLGYTIYEMLVGKHALADLPASAVLAWHLGVPLPEIDSVSAGVNSVIQRATSKDPGARYQTAQALAREFFDAVNQNSNVVFASPTQNNVTNPYKGLRPFDEADARDFFGRDAVVEQILDHLLLSNFLAVVGPSGSGKSSVVRAGVLPALREGKLPGSDDWFIITMMPGANPLQQLQTALLKVAFDPSDTLSRLLAESDTGLTDAIVNVLDIQNPLLLVIDQFEEVFTLVDDEADRQHFLELLYRAVIAPDSNLKVLITLRADFYDRPLLYENFGSLVQSATQVVLPLKTDELQQAIMHPAKRVGIDFDTELIAAIVSDVRQEPGALPLLQYALTELFEHRDGNHLYVGAYQKSGGVSGALARRAEDVFQELPAEQGDLVRQIFLRLVNPGEGTEDTRRRARYSELTAIHADRKQIQAVLDAFGKYRLLTFDNDIETREPTIEVAHEALIREWQRLRGWLNESRNDLRLQRMLSTSMHEWQVAEKDNSFLLYGTRLAQFEEWMKTSSLAISADEQAFLDSSVTAREHQEAIEAERQAHELSMERAIRRRLQAFIGLLIVASIAGVAFILIIIDRSSNVSRRMEEIASLRDASQAQQAFSEGDVISALTKAVQAVQIENPPFESVETLADVAYAPGLRYRMNAGEEAVMTVAISSDGRYLLTGSGASHSVNQGGPQGSQPPQGQNDRGGGGGQPPQGQGPQEQGGQGGPPQGGGGQQPQGQNGQGPQGQKPPPDQGQGGQQPQGQTPQTGGQADSDPINALILWDLETGQEIALLQETSASFTDIEFLPSQNGEVLKAVTASTDGHISLWDVMAGKILHDLETDTSDQITLSLSDTGLLLIVEGIEDTTSTDGRNLLLDVETWEEQASLPSFAGLWTGDISADGSFAIASSLDGTQVIWDTKTGTESHQFVLDTAIKPYSYTVEIAPDGQTMAMTTGGTHTLVLSLTGDLLNRVPSNTVVTQRVLFTEDGSTLLIESQDGLLRLWDLADGTMIRELLDRSVTLESLALKGRYAVAGTTDGQIYIWDIEPTVVREIQEFQGQPAKRAAFVPGTRQILTFGQDRGKADGGSLSVLTLWDIDTGEAVRVFGEGHAYVPQALAVSPDGHWALTGTSTHAPGVVIRPGVNNDIILWDLTTGKEVRRLSSNDTADVLSIAFDPIDPTYAIATHGQDIFLWNVDTGEMVHKYEGHRRPVKAMAFLPDGKTFASVGDDGFLKIWNLETGAQLQSFDLGAMSGFLCITPQGTSALIAGARPRDVVLLDLTTGEVIHHLMGHQDGILSCDISADGKWGVTGSWDNTFIMWNLATGTIIRHYKEVNAATWDVKFSPDQQLILSVGEAARTVLWRTAPITINEAMAWIAQNRVLVEPPPGEQRSRSYES